MKCPKCHCGDCGVTDSRARDEEASIRRRRHCTGCGLRFTTYETFIDGVPGVRLRSDGRVNPYTSRISDDVADLMGQLSDADARMVREIARRLAGASDELIETPPSMRAA